MLLKKKMPQQSPNFVWAVCGVNQEGGIGLYRHNGFGYEIDDNSLRTKTEFVLAHKKRCGFQKR